MELKLRPIPSRFSFKWRWNFGSESIAFLNRPVLLATVPKQMEQGAGRSFLVKLQLLGVLPVFNILSDCICVAQCVIGVYQWAFKQERNSKYPRDSKCPLYLCPSLLGRGGTEA